MGLTAMAVYAPGDTITSAWANIIRTNFSVLDARTGGDPGVVGYFPVSNGATSVLWTAALTAVLAALGYTPANKAGDSFTGNISTTGDVGALGNISGASLSVTGQVSGAQYAGGTTAAGTPSVKGLNVGADGFAVSGPYNSSSYVNPSEYRGGSTSAGIPSVQGLNVGTNGIASSGPISPSSYGGGTTGAGIPSVQGLNVGSNGISSAAAIFIAGQQVYWSGNPPPASAGGQVVGELRPIAAASLTAAHAAGWLTCDGSAVSRTTHAALFLAIGTAFGVGDGSTTFNVPDMRGRFPMGASGGHAQGSNGGAETVDSQHAHSGAALGVSGNTGGASALNGIGNNGGVTGAIAHTHDQGTLDVTGSTDTGGSATLSILNPYLAVNFIIYSGVPT